ncbi:hypothetical protein [Sulfitobacter sp.]|jgi:hypothetical protein|uniref:hypothetical protein n=1 Tax=Sulfitobacter sp. TaxID=1903071 RepID=UPI0030023C29
MQLNWCGICAFLASLTVASGSSAKNTIENYFDAAVHHATRETVAPKSTLREITSIETDCGSEREFVSRTVGMKGREGWPNTEGQAHEYVFHHFKRCIRRFSVVYFQFHSRWDDHASNSAEKKFFSKISTWYPSARYNEFGDWFHITEAYHLRIQKLSIRYMRTRRDVRSGLHNATSAISKLNKSKPQSHPVDQLIWYKILLAIGGVNSEELAPTKSTISSDLLLRSKDWWVM